MRAVWIVLACGCEAASPELGYDAELQVPGAQFRPGPFPAASGGPATESIVPLHSYAQIGLAREELTGILDPTAHAAIIGIDGVDGAWIVEAGPPGVQDPNAATIDATYGLSADTPIGPFTLLVASVNAAGSIGPATSVMLVAADLPPPTGDLVVDLSWDSTADLDLHVVDPLGNECWYRHPNTWQPTPGVPTDPNAYLTGGWLDQDANADCVEQSDPSENVIWTTRTGVDGLGQPIQVAPIIPSGTYTVRVDASSMCSDADASWFVAVYSEGALVGAASGVSTAYDVQYDPHGAGAGLTALQFTLP